MRLRFLNLKPLLSRDEAATKGSYPQICSGEIGTKNRHNRAKAADRQRAAPHGAHLLPRAGQQADARTAERRFGGEMEAKIGETSGRNGDGTSRS